MTEIAPEVLLRDLFDCAVKAADPMRRIPDFLPAKPKGRVVVIGAGKASARMAEAVESVWGRCEGLVITRYGYSRPCKGVEIVEAAHPVPDENGAIATKRILEILNELGPEDFVLALISGGGSALLTYPAGNISNGEKQQLNADLLASGATISQMNLIRKHLSKVKGGQLAAAAYPAQMLSLMISDVPGDDPAVIASGPTVGESSTPAQALAILNDFAIDIPKSVLGVLENNSTVVPKGDTSLRCVTNRIVAAPLLSLEAATSKAQEMGIRVKMLGDSLEGEARDLAAEQSRLALEVQEQLRPSDPPVLLLSGGECTVTRRGDGVGGPNAEFLLSAAIALDGNKGIFAISCDTDGVDGAAEVAGAQIGPDTLDKAKRADLSAEDALERNDSHAFFGSIGDQIITGPTLTNVNDFRAFLIFHPDKNHS